MKDIVEVMKWRGRQLAAGRLPDGYRYDIDRETARKLNDRMLEFLEGEPPESKVTTRERREADRDLNTTLKTLPRDGRFVEASAEEVEQANDSAIRSHSPTSILVERAWTSRDYVVQLYGGEVRRLTVMRSRSFSFVRKPDLRTISWDELLRIKISLGFDEEWAIEFYPPKAAVLNDRPQRHLWLVPLASLPAGAGWFR